MSVSRKDLFMIAGLGVLVSALPSKSSFAAAERAGKMGAMLPPPKGNRVVCGGKWAGLTVAKYLKKEDP
jgi:Uncharacterized NAD(FAD)-dependent dehydrogenases